MPTAFLCRPEINEISMKSLPLTALADLKSENNKNSYSHCSSKITMKSGKSQLKSRDLYDFEISYALWHRVGPLVRNRSRLELRVRTASIRERYVVRYVALSYVRLLKFATIAGPSWKCVFVDPCWTTATCWEGEPL